MWFCSGPDAFVKQALISFIYERLRKEWGEDDLTLEDFKDELEESYGLRLTLKTIKAYLSGSTQPGYYEPRPETQIVWCLVEAAEALDTNVAELVRTLEDLKPDLVAIAKRLERPPLTVLRQLVSMVKEFAVKTSDERSDAPDENPFAEKG